MRKSATVPEPAGISIAFHHYFAVVRSDGVRFSSLAIYHPKGHFSTTDVRATERRTALVPANRTRWRQDTPTSSH